MRYLFAAALVATTVAGFGSANAAGGCGPGFHRGPYGGCLQNYANPSAHACPRGFYVGPGGRCRANGT